MIWSSSGNADIISRSRAGPQRGLGAVCVVLAPFVACGVACAPPVQCGAGELTLNDALASLDKTGDGSIDAADVGVGKTSFVVEWIDNHGQRTVTSAVEETVRLLRTPSDSGDGIWYLATAPVRDCSQPTDMNVVFQASNPDVGTMVTGSNQIRALGVAIPRLEVVTPLSNQDELFLSVVSQDDSFFGAINMPTTVSVVDIRQPDQPLFEEVTIHILAFHVPNT